MRWALSSPGACRAINAIGSPCFKDERRRRQATLSAPANRPKTDHLEGGPRRRGPLRVFYREPYNSTPGGGMATKLEKTLEREITIDGKAYMVAISPEGVKVTQEGFRRGPELTWRSIISGEAEMGQQLKSSVGATGGGGSEGEDPPGGGRGVMVLL